MKVGKWTIKRPQLGGGKRRKKYWMIAGITAAVVLACAVGGRQIYRHFHSGTVSVYSFGDIGMTGDMIGEDTQVEGTVSADKLQTEYLTDSQTVAQVFVTKGQKVKAGDKLFAYDSTLTDLDLKRKDIAIQKKELELTTAKQELSVIQTYQAGVPIPGSTSSSSSSSSQSSESTEEETAVPTYKGLKLLSGEGTESSPYCYNWSEKFKYTESFIAAAMQGKEQAYVKFLLSGEDISLSPDGIAVGNSDEDTADTAQADDSSASAADNTAETQSAQTAAETEESTEGDSSSSSAQAASDAASGSYSEDVYAASWTMEFQQTSSGYRYTMINMTIGDIVRQISSALPDLPSDNSGTDNGGTDNGGTDDNGGSDNGTVYSAAKIAKMLAKKQQEIKKLDLELRKAKLEYTKLEQESSNSTVYSQIDGVVIKVGNPSKVGTTKPMIKISGGGGYFVTGTVNELDLNTVKVGQSVTVTSDDTGDVYDGTIKKISEYPVDNNSDEYFYYATNTNVSYYPFTITVSEDADLDIDSTVSISYTKDEQSSADSLYLMKAFVRSEDGKSYVYVADAEGKLEKRYVSTGKDLWGSYTQIKSGLSSTDQVAFPYGQYVSEGAATQEGSMEDLYSY